MSDNYTDDDRRRAWLYHQNADQIQHQRHIIFVLIETILFAAFGQTTPNVLAWIVAVVGMVVAALWCGVASMLERRLDAMRDVLKSDPIWNRYTDAVSMRHPLGGRRVFNVWLPSLTIALWLLLLFARLAIQQ